MQQHAGADEREAEVQDRADERAQRIHEVSSLTIHMMDCSSAVTASEL